MKDQGGVPRLLGMRLPSPLPGWILICIGIVFGGLMLSISRTLGSPLIYWLGLAATFGGPILGIALFVYHLRNR